MGLRWGLLGCARICRRGLIPGIRASESGEVAAIASRDVATARAWADEFGIATARGSYEALVADPGVDAVYIPLPNELHKPWALKAADAGKHVLCEKPLALDVDEARAMAAHCRDRGVLLMEAFMWRHQPRTLEVKRMVDAGAIGRLGLVRASFSFPIDPADWRLDPARGGGPLWDVGCYGVNAARLFAGAEPDRVEAVGRFAPNGVDLGVAASLRFPNGVLATVDCAFDQPFVCRYELVGTTGSIVVPDAFLPPASGPIATLRTMEVASDAGEGVDRYETLTFDAVDQYAAMVDSFARSVAAGSLEAPAEDGVAQMDVLNRILRAARGE
ncbi:Gfo/Idh/MocA family oxidoreductase [Paludisphaera sp.]|uniref:Gfo/Idh/MocA family protein n=1 Tax=Paludisphaera sp. TaxID=2017432 RepID=UPI00301BF3B2